MSSSDPGTSSEEIAESKSDLTPSDGSNLGITKAQKDLVEERKIPLLSPQINPQSFKQNPYVQKASVPVTVKYDSNEINPSRSQLNNPSQTEKIVSPILANQIRPPSLGNPGPIIPLANGVKNVQNPSKIDIVPLPQNSIYSPQKSRILEEKKAPLFPEKKEIILPQAKKPELGTGPVLAKIAPPSLSSGNKIIEKQSSDQIRKPVPVEQKLLNKGHNMAFPAISRSKIIKKVDSNRSLEVLEKVIDQTVSLIDYNKIIEDFDSIQESLMKISETRYPKAKSILEHIQNYLKCNLCQNFPKIELSCSHLFCAECCNTSLIPKVSETLPNSIILSCPICNLNLTDQEIHKLFENNRVSQNNLERELRFEMAKSGMVCMRCHKQTKEYFQSTCMHTCRECVAHSIKNQISVCEICSVPFESYDSLMNFQVNCDYCKVLVFFIGNYAKNLQDGHLLCADCLNSSLHDSACKKCEKRISKGEKLEISEFLFKECKHCKKDNYRGYFTIFKCCGVCDICASKFTECPNCGEPPKNS